MSKDDKKKNKLLKVIYYDEDAAMDYVIIINDGNITTEEINKAIEGNKASVGVDGELGIKSSLLKMLGLSLGIKSNLSGHSSNEHLINSTITTNIMTEFIKIADKDDNIEKLQGLQLEIDPDTATFLKSIFPYVALLKNPEEKIDELKEINISKIDEVILSTKGYFEFLAKKDEEDFAILRFNINCFKNNYKINDLLKMDLCYYGIKVGKTTKEAIKLENEISQKNSVLTEDDIYENGEEIEKLLPVYDIVIAGVKND